MDSNDYCYIAPELLFETDPPILKGFLPCKGSKYFVQNRVIYDENKKGKHPKSCDMFSIGVILFVMGNGFAPFIRAFPKDYRYRHMVACDYVRFWKGRNSGPMRSSEQLKGLVQDLMAYDPTTRITIPNVKQNEWFKADIYEKLRQFNICYM